MSSKRSPAPSSDRAAWVFVTALLTLSTLAAELLRPIARAAEPPTGAPKVSLVPAANPSDLIRVTAQLEVDGHLLLSAGGKTTKHVLAATGEIAYVQRRLEVTANDQGQSRAVRHYHQAKAAIQVDRQPLPARQLPDDRRLIAVASADHVTTLFSPRGPLTRDELDLVTLPGDSLAIESLLPTQPVAVGDSWTHTPALAAQLVGIDTAHVAEVRSLLKEVKDQSAKLELAGTVRGAIDGAPTEIELAAKYTFDLTQRRITWFTLSIKENRTIGHVGPGVAATSRLKLVVEPVETAAELSDTALSSFPLEAKPEQTMLVHKASGGAFELVHDRRWHVINETPKATVLRLVDRGEMIGQCNLSPLPKEAPGTATALDRFGEDVQRSLGTSFGQFVKVSQQANQRDYRVLRVEALGRVADLDIRWIYCHVGDKQGRGMAVSFTTQPDQSERFSTADATLLAGLRLVDPPIKAAAVEKSVKK